MAILVLSHNASVMVICGHIQHIDKAQGMQEIVSNILYIERIVSDMLSPQAWAAGPPLEIAARWRCRHFVKNLTVHYSSQFCVSFHFCFPWKA